jgi:integrase
MTEALRHEQLRQYARRDFSALRAYVQRIGPAAIARTWYSVDDDPYAATPGAMERYLLDMLDALAGLAAEHGSLALAAELRSAANAPEGNLAVELSPTVIEQAAQLAATQPAARHPVGMWFRPMVGRYLKQQGIATLGDLVDFCNRRGGSWWRAVRRIGPGRARHIVAWLREHEGTIGCRIERDVDEHDPLRVNDAQVVEIGGNRRRPVPLERMTVLRVELTGEQGCNRSPLFPYIHARDDLGAVRAYLNQFRERPKTQRSYTRELERFLLWCVCVRGIALSAVLADDCEAYKDFLKSPSLAFTGARASRRSIRWRPFAPEGLTRESQRYAVRTLRAAFGWLVDVRYLAGNPWRVVLDPPVIRRRYNLQIQRALSGELWEKIRRHVDAQCEPASATYWRAVRVVLLLSGDSGLRREELTVCRRENMAATQFGTPSAPVWRLELVGKRSVERVVPVSPAAIIALRAHWTDRGLDFDSSTKGPLLKPLFIPATPAAQQKHVDGEDRAYSPRAINGMLAWARKRLMAGMHDLTHDEMKQLSSMAPHSMRHTFGTQAAARNVPLDVIQRVMGHHSLTTTSIYVVAEERRIMREAAAYYSAYRDND